jgi:hypothetical protein
LLESKGGMAFIAVSGKQWVLYGLAFDGTGSHVLNNQFNNLRRIPHVK